MFILIASAIYAGMHYYVCWRITRGLELSKTASLWLRVFLIAAAFSFIAGEFLHRSLHFHALREIGAVWLGVISIAFAVFLLKDAVGFAFPKQLRLLTLGAIGLVVLLCGISLFNGLRKPVVREVRIPVAKLPKGLAGFTIVQLSDLHLTESFSHSRLAWIVDQTNMQNPDLIVITGDVIDGDIGSTGPLVSELKRLKAKHGVFFVTGNHEFYAGIGNFLGLARDIGATVLRNQRLTIADAVELVGIEDRQATRFASEGDNLKAAMAGYDPKKPVVLLSHRPDILLGEFADSIGLQLSGHVHAGQIPPMDLIVMLYYKHPRGLYQTGSSYIYTTTGTGMWGPPMRLFSRSEIVKIVLESK
jgi:predicted MPP superfamily phosphohydrolase